MEGKTAASSAQAEAQADALRSQLKDLGPRIRLEVETRRLELDSALAGRAVAQRGIEAARDAVPRGERSLQGVLSSSRASRRGRPASCARTRRHSERRADPGGALRISPARSGAEMTEILSSAEAADGPW